MKLNINYLIIEASRKCNMKCEHCLRGAPQRKTIPNNYVYKMLQLVDYASTLSIGGGEPTLAIETLEYIRQCLIYGNCDIGSFYMVTNGKAINAKELADYFYRMHMICEDNEISGVGFSFDRFHTETFSWAQKEKRDRNYDKLKETLEWECGLGENPSGITVVTKHTDEEYGYRRLKSEGRAKEFGVTDTPIEFFAEDADEDTVHFNDTELYLSCTGNIVAGCDWSYHSIDHKKEIQIAHIDDIHCTDDLIEAIRKYNKTKQVPKPTVLGMSFV